MRKVLLILFVVNIISCESSDKKNVRLTIKVVNNLTNAPVSDREIEVQKIKVSIFNRYLWEYHTDTIGKTTKDGLIHVEINSLRRYRILIYEDSLRKMFTCSYEFETRDLNLKEVLEIRCLDKSK